ncbi:MAG: electron transfer flavoprotein subunit alpha/FixB family protein, partial [Dehalococcoidia bacterium]
MTEILVLAEHRNGELREITLQMLSKAAELCQKHSLELSVAVLGAQTEGLVSLLTERAKRVVVYNDERLKHFNADTYKEILAGLIAERKPLLTLIGHTPWGTDLAPALAVKIGYPLATDCVDILLDAGKPKVVRQIYSGKIYSRTAFRESPGYLITMRGGAFPAEKTVAFQAEIVKHELPATLPAIRKEFVEFQETSKGAVDICQAEMLVSIGRGIGEAEKVSLVQDLAQSMGCVLSCSRPVVDKNWLPKCHQVGTSGKTVKPKVYLA